MARDVLPTRRRSLTIDLEHGGFDFEATVGLYDDGRVGEVFIGSGKTGTMLDITMRDLAIAVSLALQYGAPPDVLRKAFLRDDEGRPAGVMAALFDQLPGMGDRHG